MQRMRPLRAPAFAGLLLALCGASEAWANLAWVQRDGQTIVPIQTEAITMASEVVKIHHGPNGWEVDATFEMRNLTDKPVEGMIGFPVAGRSANYGFQSAVARRVGIFNQENTEFKVDVHTDPAGEPDWQEVEVTLHVETDDYSGPALPPDPVPRAGEYRENVLWAAHWEPGQTLWFRVRYYMGSSDSMPVRSCLVATGRITYVVRTGNLWAGTIGHARFEVSWLPGTWVSPEGDDSDYWLESTFPIAPGADSAVWEFKDWAPAEDIEISQVQWRPLPPPGSDDFLYALPSPYRGAEEAYTAAWIEELVDNELAQARPYFPAKVAQLDRSRLRNLIAKWLHQEIFAWRGDPFEVPSAEPENPDDMEYGDWHYNFRNYRAYKPDISMRSGVPLSDLTPMERRNVRFLRSVFAPGTEDDPTGALR